MSNFNYGEFVIKRRSPLEAVGLTIEGGILKAVHAP